MKSLSLAEYQLTIEDLGAQARVAVSKGAVVHDQVVAPLNNYLAFSFEDSGLWKVLITRQGRNALLVAPDGTVTRVGRSWAFGQVAARARGSAPRIEAIVVMALWNAFQGLFLSVAFFLGFFSYTNPLVLGLVAAAWTAGSFAIDWARDKRLVAEIQSAWE